jgi:monoterpene epsilon-lactone hydrolase
MASQELETAIAWQRDFGAANAAAGGIDEIRKINEQWFRERQGELPADLEVTEVDAGGVPAVWVGVGSEAAPVVLFIHGGGFILGAAADAYEVLGRVLRMTGGRALGVNYRLAPEHPHPAQVEDVCAAYRWLLAQGTDPGQVVVVGESAGGGLAFAALTALRDAGDPLPAAAALMSPLVDFELGAESLERNADVDPFVGREVLTMMVDALLQGQDAKAASPLTAAAAGLPPLLIQVGTSEAIYDDPGRLAQKAKAEGVDVTFEPWEEMIHLWHGFTYLPEAVEATEQVAEFLASHLAAAED